MLKFAFMSMIRLATTDDSDPILKIYAPYIENTSYTFETEVPTIDSFKERISHYQENWPWLVCEIGGVVAGYAYGSRHRERVAYQWSVECSVYVHDNYQRRGVARALYTALINILKLQGFRNLYAVINLPNDKSVSFHEKVYVSSCNIRIENEQAGAHHFSNPNSFLPRSSSTAAEYFVCSHLRGSPGNA